MGIREKLGKLFKPAFIDKDARTFNAEQDVREAELAKHKKASEAQEQQRDLQREAVVYSTAVEVYRQEHTGEPAKKEIPAIRYGHRDVYKKAAPPIQKEFTPDEAVLEALGFDQIKGVIGGLNGHGREPLEVDRVNSLQDQASFTEGSMLAVMRASAGLKGRAWDDNSRSLADIHLSVGSFTFALRDVGLVIANQGGLGNARDVCRNVEVMSPRNEV
jgi:hypothetical protein